MWSGPLAGKVGFRADLSAIPLNLPGLPTHQMPPRLAAWPVWRPAPRQACCQSPEKFAALGSRAGGGLTREASVGETADMAVLADRSTVGRSSRASTILTNSSTPFAARRAAKWRITCAKICQRQQSDPGLGVGEPYWARRSIVILGRNRISRAHHIEHPNCVVDSAPCDRLMCGRQNFR